MIFPLFSVVVVALVSVGIVALVSVVGVETRYLGASDCTVDL